MKWHFFARLASTLALVGLLTAPSLAQPTSSPGYPNWTGTSYPFEQHLSIMLLHFDDTALAMARTAQEAAKSASVKHLAATVIPELTQAIDAMRSAYAKKYGQQPPAWPNPQSGYGPGMMFGNGGAGMIGGRYGPGMMYGPGSNGGTSNGGTWYGPMMGYGDGYQMMMGRRAYWWGSSSNVDAGFVPSLMRLDAMEISMATLGLTATDPSTKVLVQGVVSARTAELSHLAQTIKS